MPVATIRTSSTSPSGWSESEGALGEEVSSIAFHSPHVGHCPVQRTAVAPHEMQR